MTRSSPTFKVVSEYISLHTDSNRVEFSGKGDSGEAEIVLESGSEGLEDLNVKEVSAATHVSDYLSKITKAIGAVGSSIACHTQDAAHALSSELPILEGSIFTWHPEFRIR